jgi:simple sugar transport system permease protein
MLPVLFAASGGLFPAVCGTLNIAMEGMLLAGAFSSLAVFYHTGNIPLSVAAAVFAAMALSAVHAFGAFKLRANVFITGLALNLFSSGICIVLSDRLFNTRGVIASQSISSAPQIFLFLGLFLVVVSWTVINKTPFGLRLRACGNNTEALASLGMNPEFYRTAAFLISGFFCGIGGSFLSLYLGAFVPGMSAGRGWIALVIIFLGRRKPHGILAAAFIFALADSFSLFAQGFWSLPAYFMFAFPYIFALFAMILVSAFSTANRNAGL